MKKRVKKKILYEKYLEDHKEELERSEFEQKLNVDTVVVKKMTTGAKVAQIMADVLRWGTKVIIAVIVLGLLSLAVTVIINEPLRMMVFEYLKN